MLGGKAEHGSGCWRKIRDSENLQKNKIPVSNQRGKVWGEKNGNLNYFPSKLSFEFQKEGIR